MTDMHARELAAAQDRSERVQDAAEAIRQARCRPEGEGALAALWAAGGGIAVPAAGHLRRMVRRAAWQPRAVLRGLWARLRAAWRERSE